MFKSTTIGVLLFITHLLACITVGFIFRFWKSSTNTISTSQSSSQFHKNQTVSVHNLGEILSESITSATSTILLIGGFVVIFSSIISILNTSGLIKIMSILISPLFNILRISSDFSAPFISGFFEITNGINSISCIASKKLSINIVLTSFLLGFGGISIMFQVFSIVSKTDLSIKPYIYGKLLQGIISAFYTYIFINSIPIFFFDL
ncbi:MAG: hypothetical protein HUJ68_08945 [Clostridia bacterium]|nr:hypothetical protein [Clostridia bacterium]